MSMLLGLGGARAETAPGASEGAQDEASHRFGVAHPSFVALLAEEDSAAVRILRDEPAPHSALFAQLRGMVSAARASAMLGYTAGPAVPEYVLRNADNPDEAYAFSGFHKYSYISSTPLKWTTTISWKYNPAGQSTLFTEEEIVNALIEATNRWEAVCNVKFSYAGKTATAPSLSSCDGQNVVGWAPLSGGTVGRTQACWSGSAINQFDIGMDNEQPYQLTSLSLFRSVATHEFGHALGLGHTSVSPAVMTSSVTTGNPVQDDIDGCVSLYGAPSSSTPAVSLSPSSLSFASQTVSTTSPAQTVTLTNSGGGTLTLSSLTLGGANPGDYNRAGTCSAGGSLGAGQSCTITITFTPLAAGTRSASVSVASNATGSPHAVSLTGTGADAVPIATLSTGALSYGNQNVGTTSNPKTVRVTNTGGGSLSIGSLTLGGSHPGDFGRSGCNAGTTLAAGAYCDMSVTFAPSASGTRSASLSVATNAGTPTVSLTGSGVTVAPAVSLSSTTLSFGNQTVGTTSAAQSITLSNTGNGSLTISGIAKSGTHSGEFVVGGTCPSSGTIAAGASCTIAVQFAPVGAGTRTASVAVTTNAPGSPHAIALSGSGVDATPLVPAPSLSSSSVSFGSQTIGTTSAAQTVTLSNTGTAGFTISSIGIQGSHSADFARGGTCGAGTSLAPGASCTISATFTPQALGTRSASVAVTTGAGNLAVALSGTGADISPVASVSPGSVTFASTSTGSRSGSQVVRLTNGGGGSLGVTGISIGGPNASEFAWTGGCAVGTVLAAGQSCDVYVSFGPTSAGSKSASLGIATTVASTSVALSGSAVDATAPPVAKYSVSAIAFKDQTVGTTSRKRSFSLTNSGGQSLVVQQIGMGGATPQDFAVSGTCAAGLALAPAQACSLSVAFTPTAAGARGAEVIVVTNVSASGDRIALSGNGVLGTTGGKGKASANADLVEYYNAELDHYFITAFEEEVDALDGKKFRGWQRTGHQYLAAPSIDVTPGTTLLVNSVGQAAAPQLAPVCRFYGSPARGLDSHFYSGSPAECAQVAAKFPEDWLLETAEAMFVYLPDAQTGACPAGSVPLYRLWNQRRDSNHRYTTDASVREQMIAKGWLSEGYGPLGVAMCLPAE